MTTNPEPVKKTHPSTYVVTDQSSILELERLDEQDRLFTTSMGGLLPEQTDVSRFKSVLDVGCGPGWWLIEIAKTYPHITRLVGVDISEKMIQYANEQAVKAGVQDRVHFQTGDALRMLEFPKQTFDLINQRFGMSFLRQWDWPKLLREYQRISKRRGIIRITELSIPETSSPALNQLLALALQAMTNSGNFFTPERDGVIRHIAPQMKKYGIAQVQTRTMNIIYNANNPDARHMYIEDVHRVYRTIAPFLKKWASSSEDYEATYQRMLEETQQPDFEASLILLTAWGINHKSSIPHLGSE